MKDIMRKRLSDLYFWHYNDSDKDIKNKIEDNIQYEINNARLWK